MRESTMEILCCPVCKGDLLLGVDKSERREDGELEILSGTLTCSACAVVYPIEDGIPDLLPRKKE